MPLRPKPWLALRKGWGWGGGDGRPESQALIILFVTLAWRRLATSGQPKPIGTRISNVKRHNTLSSKCKIRELRSIKMIYSSTQARIVSLPDLIKRPERTKNTALLRHIIAVINIAGIDTRPVDVRRRFLFR
jgi:hypothetical protein